MLARADYVRKLTDSKPILTEDIRKMPLTDRDHVTTAMIRKTNQALASTMRRIRETGELLDASQAFLHHHKRWEETRGANPHNDAEQA